MSSNSKFKPIEENFEEVVGDPAGEVIHGAAPADVEEHTKEHHLELVPDEDPQNKEKTLIYPNKKSQGPGKNYLRFLKGNPNFLFTAMCAVGFGAAAFYFGYELHNVQKRIVRIELYGSQIGKLKGDLVRLEASLGQNANAGANNAAQAELNRRTLDLNNRLARLEQNAVAKPEKKVAKGAAPGRKTASLAKKGKSSKKR